MAKSSLKDAAKLIEEKAKELEGQVAPKRTPDASVPMFTPAKARALNYSTVTDHMEVARKAGRLSDMVAVDLIDTDDNTRDRDVSDDTFENEEFELLCKDVAEHGLINAISIMKGEGGRYKLIAGRRRLEAHRRLGKENILAIVREANDIDAISEMLRENLHRSEITFMERAKAIAAIHRNHGKEIATQIVGNIGLTQSSASKLNAAIKAFDPWLWPLIQDLRIIQARRAYEVAKFLNAADDSIRETVKAAATNGPEDPNIQNTWDYVVWLTVGEGVSKTASSDASGGAVTEMPAERSALVGRKVFNKEGRHLASITEDRGTIIIRCSKLVSEAAIIEALERIEKDGV